MAAYSQKLRPGPLPRPSARTSRLLLAALLLFVVALPASAAVSVTISPANVNLSPGGTQTFEATVTGTANLAVTWTVQEGAAGGTITSSGAYTAPNAVGVYHVVATSQGDSTQNATATVVVPGFTFSGLLTQRTLHTATLLPDGKVLFAGGQGTSGTGALDSAELYDPATDTFAPTGSMTSPRNDHTATLLPNGKVLIAGGSAPLLTSASAELYDPISGTFTATGSMSTPRQGHTATLLSSGKVLIAGGGNCNSGCVSFASAEVYDPTTGTFSATGSMSAARSFAQATLLSNLSNGKVLIAGGFNSSTLMVLSSAELYDPAAGTFTPTGGMSTPRQSFTATLLPNGKVLVAAGVTTGALGSAEVFDPATGGFTATGNLNEARFKHTATLLPTGKVLITSGFGAPGVLASAELYDPSTGRFTSTGNVNDPRIDFTATLLSTGKILIAGGSNVIATLGSAELYDPAGGAFTTKSVFMSAPRTFHTATQLPDGRALIAGGIHCTLSCIVYASAELYDPATGKFTPTGSMATGRQAHTATLLKSGKVLLVGGFGGASSPVLASAELYDPATGTFAATGSPATPRTLHTATLLPDGRVLVAGGQGPSGALASAEVYDPVAGAFTATGTMASPRQSHTATLLNTGKVLIAGGNNGNRPFNAFVAAAELYDPAGGTFTKTGTMNATQDHTATLLPDGKVLVGSGFQTSQLYDPSTGNFTFTGQEAVARRLHTATLLLNGQVLLAGGATRGEITASAELYDPATAAFADTGNMRSHRQSHTASLLPNGHVLIAGGGIGQSGLASIEIYQAPGPTPVSTLSSVSPNSLTGFNPVTITVQGSNFLSATTVNLDGARLPTTPVSSTQLTAVVPTSALVAIGSHSVTVTNFGGGISPALSITVNNPLLGALTGLNFGSLPVGTASLPQTLSLNNTGNATLNIASITITGANSTDFAIGAGTTCPTNGGTIPPFTGCLVGITFTAGATGSRTASITIADNAFGNPHSATLSGTGIAPGTVNFSSSGLSFGDQPVGVASPPRAVTLTNNGGGTLTITSITLTNTADFSKNDNCGASLNAGANCTITVTFTPTGIGARVGAIVINASDSGSPHSLPLVGNGSDFTLSPAGSSSTTATINAGQTAAYRLTLVSSGFGGTITFTCTGAPTGGNCTVSPSSITVNGSGSVTITVTATTTARGLNAPREPGSSPLGELRLHLRWLLCVAVVLLLALAKVRRRVRLGFAGALLMFMACLACGGGGAGPSSSAPPQVTGTPAGSYHLTVTGTSSGVSRAITLTLNVN